MPQQNNQQFNRPQQQQWPQQNNQQNQWQNQQNNQQNQWQNQQWQNQQNNPQRVFIQQQWPSQQQPQQIQKPNPQPTQEPVLINTVIQVYTNENAPNELFSELKTLSSVNGNDRVEISRNTTLDTNYGTLVREPSGRNHGNFVSNFTSTSNCYFYSHKK